MEFSELLPPREQDVTRLSRLLQSLCSDENAVQEALSQIMRESEMLESEASMAMGETRHELRGLIKALNAASFRLEFNHPLALQTFCDEWNQPIGAAKQQISEMCNAATRALASLENNQPDYGRREFAYRIAKILQDTLGIKPTATHYEPSVIKGVKGGAAYARVLKVSMRLAKVTPPKDLRDLMRAGLSLLNSDARGDQV